MNYSIDYAPDSVPSSTPRQVGVTARKTLGALYDLGWRGLPKQKIYISDAELPTDFPDGKKRWTCGVSDSIEGCRVTVNNGSIMAWLSVEPTKRYEPALEEVVGHEIVHNAFVISPPSILEGIRPQSHRDFFDYKADLREMFTESLTRKILGLIE